MCRMYQKKPMFLKKLCFLCALRGGSQGCIRSRSACITEAARLLLVGDAQ